MELCKCGRKKDYRSEKCNICVKLIPYSKEEDEIIIKNYPEFSSKDISKLINRSPSAIRHRAVDLKLANNKEYTSYKLSKYSAETNRFGANNSSWKGGKVIRKSIKGKSTYILIYCRDHPNKDCNGYVPEHRLMVEEKIKRFLLPKEVVHHLDGNTQNNDINNLMLFENNSKHIHFHRRIDQVGMTSIIKREIENRWNNLNEVCNESGVQSQ